MTGVVLLTKGCRGENGGGKRRRKGEESDEQQQNQVSFVAILLAAIRKSMVSCRVDRNDKLVSAVHHMEIGWPTNVRHVAHVTFDRFNGFLGLPVEFEVEIPSRVPSASASVFGVSAESMQCSYDSKGNSVPLILLLMQERLYSQGGLKAEGIFRINPENSQEEHVRDQLNKGIVPDDIDVHCLAGLIKAWFRELPAGVLDGLSPEQVLECNTEEESADLVKLLLPTQAALLNWAVDLMADVVEEEEINKMNARNIAMVFAPNMTKMSDPLTALMHAVQVMNFLKTLILKTLREREETAAGGSWLCSSPSDRQTHEDFDSEQEDMSCDEHTLGDDNINYCHSSGEEGDSFSDVNESLVHLDGSDVHYSHNTGKQGFLHDPEKLDIHVKGEHISPIIYLDAQARQPENSDFIAEFSISDSKNENSSTSEGEESVMSVSIGDMPDTTSSLKVCDGGSEIGMVETRVESLSCLSSCLSPGQAN